MSGWPLNCGMCGECVGKTVVNVGERSGFPFSGRASKSGAICLVNKQRCRLLLFHSVNAKRATAFLSKIQKIRNSKIQKFKKNSPKKCEYLRNVHRSIICCFQRCRIDGAIEISFTAVNIQIMNSNWQRSK